MALQKTIPAGATLYVVINSPLKHLNQQADDLYSEPDGIDTSTFTLKLGRNTAQNLGWGAQDVLRRQLPSLRQMCDVAARTPVKVPHMLLDLCSSSFCVSADCSRRDIAGDLRPRSPALFRHERRINLNFTGVPFILTARSLFLSAVTPLRPLSRV